LEPALCYYHRPGSTEAEAYRLVRTSLFVCAGPRRERVIQVTSPEPGDGKTTLASNLAIAMAQSGKKVLLIDADLRRPTVHKLFRASREIGMVDVLAGNIDLLTAVQGTTATGLSLLTAGESPVNPAELLSSARFAEMVEQARQEFDFVLIDTPPLLAVSDPCIVSPQCDALLLVVRMMKNRRLAVKRSRELLETQGIHVIGVVANAVDAGSADGYGGEYTEYFVTESRPAGAAGLNPPVAAGAAGLNPPVAAGAAGLKPPVAAGKTVETDTARTTS
jgi:capsular exopolysaccharide synthesis family protein